MRAKSPKYVAHSFHEKPTPHKTLAFIEVRMIGSKIGNPNIAVSVELLFVLEAIAETKVRIEAMPELPKIITAINTPLFSTGFPKSIEKNARLIRAITISKIELNMILDKIKFCGETKL